MIREFPIRHPTPVDDPIRRDETVNRRPLNDHQTTTTRTFRISPSEDIHHPPEYPTILPKTVCNDENDWGSWRINRDLDIKKIREQQKECQDNRDDFITTIESIERPNMPKVESRLQHSSQMDHHSIPAIANPNTCYENIARTFPTLNHYCRSGDNRALDLSHVTRSVCEGGDYGLMCANPENFTALYQTGVCDKKDGIHQGLYLCQDGKISCEPCTFDRLQFERDLHSAFLKKHCRDFDGGEECENYGYNREKEESYQRGHRYDFDHEISLAFRVNFSVDSQGNLRSQEDAERHELEMLRFNQINDENAINNIDDKKIEQRAEKAARGFTGHKYWNRYYNTYYNFLYSQYYHNMHAERLRVKRKYRLFTEKKGFAHAEKAISSWRTNHSSKKGGRIPHETAKIAAIGKSGEDYVKTYFSTFYKNYYDAYYRTYWRAFFQEVGEEEKEEEEEIPENTYQYFKWTVTETRTSNSYSINLTSFQFKIDDEWVSPSSVIEGPLKNRGGHGITNLLNTNHSSDNGFFFSSSEENPSWYCVFVFDNPVHPTHYRWAGRLEGFSSDPRAWKLEGSNDSDSGPFTEIDKVIFVERKIDSNNNVKRWITQKICYDDKSCKEEKRQKQQEMREEWESNRICVIS